MAIRESTKRQIERDLQANGLKRGDWFWTGDTINFYKVFHRELAQKLMPNSLCRQSGDISLVITDSVSVADSYKAIRVNSLDEVSLARIVKECKDFFQGQPIKSIERGKLDGSNLILQVYVGRRLYDGSYKFQWTEFSLGFTPTSAWIESENKRDVDHGVEKVFSQIKSKLKSFVDKKLYEDRTLVADDLLASLRSSIRYYINQGYSQEKIAKALSEEFPNVTAEQKKLAYERETGSRVDVSVFDSADDTYVQVDMRDPWGGTRSLIVHAPSVGEAKLKAQESHPDWVLIGTYQSSYGHAAHAKTTGMYVDNESVVADSAIIPGEGKSWEGHPWGLYVDGGKKYRGFEIVSEENGLRKGVYRFYNFGISGIHFGNSARDGQFTEADFKRLINEGKVKLLDSCDNDSVIRDADETVAEIDLDNEPSVDGEQKVKLHTGGKVIEVEVESEEHEREERLGDSLIKAPIVDAKEYTIHWQNSYEGTKDKTTVSANSVREAVEKFKEEVTPGWGNVFIINISPNDGWVALYGKIDKVLRELKDSREYVGNAQIIPKSELPKVGDVYKPYPRFGRAIKVSRSGSQDGYSIYKVWYRTDQDSKYSEGLDNASSFSFAVKDSKKQFEVKDSRGRKYLVIAMDYDEAVKKVRALKNKK